eukprot:COSAG02_NODE_130_length_34758_cov_80.817767_38_plen_100_part_00
MVPEFTNWRHGIGVPSGRFGALATGREQGEALPAVAHDLVASCQFTNSLVRNKNDFSTRSNSQKKKQRLDEGPLYFSVSSQYTPQTNYPVAMEASMMLS